MEYSLGHYTSPSSHQRLESKRVACTVIAVEWKTQTKVTQDLPSRWGIVSGAVTGRRFPYKLSLVSQLTDEDESY